MTSFVVLLSLVLRLDLPLAETYINENEGIFCSFPEPCIVICNISFACQGITIEGPESFPLNIFSSNSDALSSSIINALESSHLNIELSGSLALTGSEINGPSNGGTTYIYGNGIDTLLDTQFNGGRFGGSVEVVFDTSPLSGRGFTVDASNNTDLTIKVINGATLSDDNFSPFRAICRSQIGEINCRLNCTGGSSCGESIAGNANRIKALGGTEQLLLYCQGDACDYLNVTCDNGWEQVFNGRLNGPCDFGQTDIPTALSEGPTNLPSMLPSFNPSSEPSLGPTLYPTYIPSSNPSILPTLSPTNFPSLEPTILPIKGFSTMPPTLLPVWAPTDNPTKAPHPTTVSPSITPSEETSHPSLAPSGNPTKNPSVYPSLHPTSNPSQNPTMNPSQNPTNFPSKYPSFSPSNVPSMNPSNNPSNIPSNEPTLIPSKLPTRVPSLQPTNPPSKTPTQSTKNDSKNNDSSVGTVIGLIVASGIASIFLIAVVFYFARKKQEGKKKDILEKIELDKVTSTSYITPTKSGEEDENIKPQIVKSTPKDPNITGTPMGLKIDQTKNNYNTHANTNETNDTNNTETIDNFRIGEKKSSNLKVPYQLKRNETEELFAKTENNNVTKGNIDEEENDIEEDELFDIASDNNVTKGNMDDENIIDEDDEIVKDMITEKDYTPIKDGNTMKSGEDVVNDNEEGEKIELGDVKHWNVDKVIVWLTNIVGFPQYSEIFVKNQIDGEVLLSLNDTLLENFGIEVYGHRFKIVHAIKKL